MTRVSRLSWAFVGVLLALGASVLVLAYLRSLVVPLVVAGFAAVVFAPAVDWLEHFRLPRPAAAAAITLLVLGTGVGVVVVVTAGIVDRADELSAQLVKARTELERLLDTLPLADVLPAGETELQNAGSFVFEGIAGRVGSILDSAVAFVSGTALALVVLYYLLKDGPRFVTAAAERRNPEASAQSKRIIASAFQRVRAYSRGRAALALAQGAFLWLALTVLGVPLALTIALVNFVGAFIPYLGAFVGGAFAVVIALSDGSVSLALVVLVVVLIMNLVLENLLEPRLIGSSMAMHPLAVLVATVAGGMAAGLVGFVLGAPVAAIGSDLFRELRNSGFFGDAASDA